MLKRKWWTLLATSVAVFMLLVDLTVVTVALPSLQRSLGASFDDLQWVVNAYALTLAALLLTAGVLADRFGRKRVFLAGLTVFTLASLVCGLSGSAQMLYWSRAGQGVGDAMMFAASLALLADAFRGDDRATAFGIFGAVTGAAAALGPLIGGVITSTLGWRWVFFVNVPVGAVGALIAVAFVRESKDPGAGRGDWLGCAAFTASLFLLVLALVRGNADGWSSTTIVGLFVGAAISAVVFVGVEWWQRDPALDLPLLRRPAMVGVTLAGLAVSASLLAALLYLTLYLQDAMGLSPFAVGVRLLPVTLLAFAVAPMASAVAVRLPARAVLGTGLSLVAVGLALMAASGPQPDWLRLLPGLVVCGAGVGAVNPVLNATAVRVVPVERSGMASGVNTTFRQLGVAVGVASLGAVFESELRTGMLGALESTPAGRSLAHDQGGALVATLHAGALQGSSALPAGTRQLLDDAYRVAFSSALHHLVAIAAVIAAGGAVAAFALVRQRDLHPVPAPAPVRGRPSVPAGARGRRRGTPATSLLDVGAPRHPRGRREAEARPAGPPG